jgi:outer membrane immunogenic protein
MRALRLAAAAIMAMGTGLPIGTASADGVVRSADPYIYAAPADVRLTYDWTGFYVGGQVGGANASTKANDDSIHNPDCFQVPSLCPPESTLATERLGLSSNGFVGGGFVGLQKQWSWLVFGAEVGYHWINQSASSVSALESAILRSNPASGIDPTKLSTNVQNLFLVTGKFGWAYDNILAYFKGGWASGDVDFRTSSTLTGALLTTSSGRESGWTAGAGLEYALREHLILGVEYNYVELNPGTRTQNAVGTGPVGTHIQAGVDIQSVTARLSFKFGGLHN